MLISSINIEIELELPDLKQKGGIRANLVSWELWEGGLRYQQGVLGEGRRSDILIMGNAALKLSRVFV